MKHNLMQCESLHFAFADTSVNDDLPCVPMSVGSKNEMGGGYNNSDSFLDSANAIARFAAHGIALQTPHAPVYDPVLA